MSYLCILSLILLTFSPCSCLLESTHKTGDVIKIGMGNINSIETQLPFKQSYLNLCHQGVPPTISDNLGELLTGNTITESLYEAKVNVNETCKLLCTKNITSMTVKTIKWLSSHSYTSSFYIDQLPAAKGEFNFATNSNVYDYHKGIPIGFAVGRDPVDQVIMYNHYSFHISIHKVDEDKFEIVGFSVFPYSIKQNEDDLEACRKPDSSYDIENPTYGKINVLLKEGVPMTFSYDVMFVESNLTMVSRWDYYTHLNSQIHWFGLINSNVIILIFAFVIIFIFCRALKKDIEVYNLRVTGDDFIDEFGWKQVCNDVFRKPIHHMVLSALIGTGIQLFLMLFLSLFVSMIGFLKPESRGNLITIMIFLFVLMGLFGGYTSSRLYKTFHGANWLKNAILTAFLYPGMVFVVFWVINFFFAVEGSAGTIKFTEMVSLLILWLCCSTPLVLIGSFIGIKRKLIKPPCRINSCPSTIPVKPWYFKIKYMIWITGLIPFGAIFVEFSYIMASLWRHQIYLLFGFLWVAVIVLIITSAEMSIIVVYLCLCKGDYNWWWKSFFIGGSSAMYFVAYSLFYFFKLNIVRFSAVFVYFGAMTLISSVAFLVCGSISVLLTFAFLHKIYSMIKID